VTKLVIRPGKYVSFTQKTSFALKREKNRRGKKRNGKEKWWKRRKTSVGVKKKGVKHERFQE
jgi:hypothetical protein